jgi:hypothetical protein
MVHTSRTFFWQPQCRQFHQCWMVIGLAVRTAQSLGLHLPETSAQISSPRRQQMTRRFWYGCVLMDTTLMTYGRPTMVKSHAATVVPLPLAASVSIHSVGTHTAEHSAYNDGFPCPSVTSEQDPSRRITGLLQVFRHRRHRRI